jgi:hypothetical protein
MSPAAVSPKTKGSARPYWHGTGQRDGGSGSPVGIISISRVVAADVLERTGRVVAPDATQKYVN